MVTLKIILFEKFYSYVYILTIYFWFMVTFNFLCWNINHLFCIPCAISFTEKSEMLIIFKIESNYNVEYYDYEFTEKHLQIDHILQSLDPLSDHVKIEFLEEQSHQHPSRLFGVSCV